MAGPVVITNPSPDTRAVGPVVLRGAVVDTRGEPVVDAAVRVTSAAGGEIRAELRTDAQGSYQAALRDSSPVDVTIEADGLGPSRSRRFPARRARPVTVLGPRLPWNGDGIADDGDWVASAIAAEGFVKGDGDELVPGALVVVEETGLSTRSDEIGRFRIGITGSCTLRVTSDDGRVGTLELSEIPRRQGLLPIPDVRLEPGLSLEGVVTQADGAVAAGVAVKLRAESHRGFERWVTTDAAGAFQVDGLVGEPLLVSVAPTRGGLGVSARVVPGRDASVVHLKMVAERPLRLQVVHGSGRAAAGVHVFATQAGGLRRAYAQADDAGFVGLRGLAAQAADAIEFEVRAAGTLADVAVLAFDAEGLRLTVE